MGLTMSAVEQISVGDLVTRSNVISDAIRNGISDLDRQVERELLALPAGHRLCLHAVESMTDSFDWHDDVITVKFRRRWHTLGPDDSCVAPTREELTRQ